MKKHPYFGHHHPKRKPITVLPDQGTVETAYSKLKHGTFDEFLGGVIEIEAERSRMIEVQRNMNEDILPVDYYQKTGKRLRRNRTKLGMDVIEAAKLLGIFEEEYRAIERGDLVPSKETAVKIKMLFRTGFKCPCCGNAYLSDGNVYHIKKRESR